MHIIVSSQLQISCIAKMKMQNGSALLKYSSNFRALVGCESFAFKTETKRKQNQHEQTKLEKKMARNGGDGATSPRDDARDGPGSLRLDGPTGHEKCLRNQCHVRDPRQCQWVFFCVFNLHRSLGSNSSNSSPEV